MIVRLTRGLAAPILALTLAATAAPLAGCGSSTSGSDPVATATPETTPTPLPALGAGQLDPTFGDAGIALTTFAEGEAILDIALQPDGRIVAAGTIGGDLAVARYDAAGQLDPTFGGGIVRVDFGGTAASANAIVLQPDGRIVFGGSADDAALLGRMTATGELDPTFGEGGVVTDAIPGFFTVDDVALQSDGGVVATGRSGVHGALARYQTDGTPDPRFGTSGVVVYGTEPNICWFNSVVVQPDDALVAGGTCISDAPVEALLARYAKNADDAPQLLLSMSEALGGGPVTDLALGPEGALVVAATSRDQKLIRVDASGTASAFGDAGDTPIGRGFEIAAIALDSAGRVVAAGSFSPPGKVPQRVLVVARFGTDGLLDTSFGVDGFAWGGGADVSEATGLVIQPDGKIVVAAAASPSGFALLRFGGDPTP